MVTLWHLSTNPKWKLDPNYHPIWAYGGGYPCSKPGLFVTDRPIYWIPFMDVGPVYVVRVEVPEEAMPPFSVSHPEFLITDLDKIQVAEILPLEEVIIRGQAEKSQGIPWDRQRYGSFGGVEDWWFHSYEVWDDKQNEQIRVWRKRKGLSRLMKKWREDNPGYKNPMDKHEKEHKAGRK